MPKSELEALIGRLNYTCKSALEAGAGLSLLRTHYEVEPAHFLLKLLDQSNTDFKQILRHFEIDSSKLNKDLEESILKIKTGNTDVPTLSPLISYLLQEASMAAVIYFRSPSIRSGHIIMACVSDYALSYKLTQTTDLFGRISPDTLIDHMRSICAGSIEDIDKVDLHFENRLH